MTKLDKTRFTGSQYKPFYQFWKQFIIEDHSFSFFQKSAVLNNNFPKEVHTFQIEPSVSKALSELVKNNDSGIFVVLTAALGILLKKYTEKERVIIHSPLFKQEKDVEIFEQFVPIVFSPERGISFKDYLVKIKQTVLESYRFQNFPLSLLVDNQDEGLFQSNVLFSFDNIHQATAEIESYDLHFKLKVTSPSEIVLEVYFDPEVYESVFIHRFQSHLHQVLQHLQNLDASIESIEILSPSEKNQLVHGPSLLNLFEQKVLENPEVNAVNFEGTNLTYRQLNEKANKLAKIIREDYGIKPESTIGILLPRSEKMVVALMAIIKSGAAFLPIDVSYPQERIAYLLEDSGTSLLLTDSSLNAELRANYPGNCVFMDQLQYDEDFGNLVHINKPGDLAYVIYTSGSTGKPKGVELQHDNFLHYISWANDYYFKEQKEIHFPLFTSLSFDLTITCIFTTLLRGNTIFVYPDNMEVMDILRDIFDSRTCINAVKLTPSHISLVSHLNLEKTNIDHLITGGEALTAPQVKCLQQLNPSMKIYNEYGPTEATVGCIVKDVENPENITIGKPIVNTQIYLIDEQENLVPIGLKGEIVIGGAGIARGYLNKPELTAQKFITNPFSSKGDKIYKTGDLGRWLPNGELEYLGRCDSQVKIRGNRIELSEIEQVLLSHPDIEEAVITVKEEVSSKTLVAYFKSRLSIDASSLREFLISRLPDYMVPSYFVQLQVFPLTANGKINTKALPDPIVVKANTAYKASSTDKEAMVQKVWIRVLGREKISVDENFFVIGGDSIKAVQISSLLYQEGLQIRVGDLLQNPTIESLAKIVRDIDVAAPQGIVSGQVPLTPIQHDFFKAPRKFPNHFNFALMFKLDAGVEEKMLREVFVKIQEHHDALRMTFQQSELGVIQLNHGLDYEFHLEEVDLRDFFNSNVALEELEAKAETIQAGFQLEKGPLMKLVLFRMEDSDRLLIVIHHLVMDVVSWRIVFEDITTLFQQYQSGEELTLPLKTNSFKDWALQLQSYANNPDFLASEAPYWSRLAQEPRQILPQDFYSSTLFIEDSEKWIFKLDEKHTQELLFGVSERLNTEINDVLLTALSLAVKQTFGIENLLLDMEGHGREEITDLNITRTVGYFTSTYPILINSKEDDLEKHLLTVKAILREIPFKGIGFGLLKHLSPAEYSDAVQMSSQICFNYFGQFDGDLDHLSIPLASEPTGHTQNPKEIRHAYNFYITGYVENSELVIRIDFSNKQYKITTVERLANAFKTCLEEIVILNDKELLEADITL